MASTDEPSLKLVANKNNSYPVNCGLKYEQFRECVLTPSGRLLFFPGIRNIIYEFLDFVNGKVSTMQLKQSQIFTMRRLKLFPLDDYSVLLIANSSDSLNKPFLDYYSAVFELKRDENSASSNQRTVSWAHTIKIDSKSTRLFFQVDNRVYLMCTNKQRVTTLHYYDLNKCGRLVKNFTNYSIKVNSPIRKLERYSEFMTYKDGYIYAFKRLSRFCNRSKNIHAVNNTYSNILQQNTVNGRTEIVPLNNFQCLKIPANTFNSESIFVAEGQWWNEYFYLHLKIRIPTAARHPTHYFAVLNLSTLSWSSIHVTLPPHRLQCPLKMLMTSQNIMILLQFHNTPKKTTNNEIRRNPIHRCREHARLYKPNYYRIPISQPESLRVLSQLSLNRYLATQPETIRMSIRQKCQNILIQPLY